MLFTEEELKALEAAKGQEREKLLIEYGRRYISFLEGRKFVFLSSLKTFDQTAALEKAKSKLGDKGRHIDARGACYGLSLDWARRWLLSKTSYFKKKDDQKVKVLLKGASLQQHAQKAQLNSNTTGLTDEQVTKLFNTAIGNYKRERSKDTGFENLQIKRQEFRLRGETFEKYQYLADKLAECGIPANGTAVLISFVGYSGSAGGHTIAVANIGGSLLFFDPNLGERQFKTLDGKGIVDAIAACWVTGFTSDTGLLRIETLSLKGGASTAETATSTSSTSSTSMMN